MFTSVEKINMKNNQKGFVIPLIIAIVVILATGGYLYYYANYNKPFEVITPNPSSSTTDNIVGNDRDEHGCIGSAGYSWCAVKNKCLREWEEKCEAIDTTNPVACTADATQCPDGSYVGRSSPKCEFICPANISTVSILSPNGGEILSIGSNYIVRWNDDSDAGNKNIYVINQTTNLISNIVADNFMRSSGIDGIYSYDWIISNSIVPGSYKLKICKSDVNECDLSDNYFTIN